MKSGDIELGAGACAIAFSLLLTGTSALAQQSPGAAPEDGVLENIVVTAQRREENLIDVPIAVSAFDNAALERRQIEQASDLQLNIPNVSFTKTNFTGSNFQIRGIGVSSIGASSDSGVETHFNSMPIKIPRLFETDYFDLQRLEVLRGPQGTLYGRNATGGAVNVLPAKPVLGEFAANVEVEGGNFNEVKVKGMINVPLGDVLGLRIAGLSYDRDGFTRNLTTGNDIDGRDQYAARATLRFTPSDATDVNLTVNYFNEDSNRARTLKQLCNPDPTGAVGCLPGKPGFGTVNARGTLGGTLGELLPVVVGAPQLALIPLGVNGNANVPNPANLRQVAADFDPTYEADETIVTLELSQEIGSFTLTSITGYQETSLIARTDFNQNMAGGPFNGPGFNPDPMQRPLLQAFGGLVPLSGIDPSLMGFRGGNILALSDRSIGYDQSDQDADQFSQEVRIASNFEGKVNFQIGALYFDADDEENYYVATTELDYASLLFQALSSAPGAAPLPGAPPIFLNGTPSASLESTALFGEFYYQATDSFKLTTGLRYTRDEKGIVDRNLLLSVPVGAPLPDFRTDKTTFTEVTGRFGFDWKPGWFDDSTVYAFYSRGYKAGGFNPPVDRTNPSFAGTPDIYDPEFINSIEVGSKNVLADGRVQANFSAFYYKYDDLQVSKIVARTSVNENVDANIYGLEGEFVFLPMTDVVVDLNLSYLNSRIKNASSIDPRNPTNSNGAFTTIKDIATAGNYVLPTANLPAAIAAGCVLDPQVFGGPFGLAGLNPACGAPFGATDGIATDLDGNELPGAPQFSAKLGAQYTYNFSGGQKLTPRLDYYWRDDFETRIFNSPGERLKGFAILNAQIDYLSADESWYLRGYVNNVQDRNAITGSYLSDAAAGLFTNVFLLDPRTYGLAVGKRF
jgi:outer membrane receptor protein involved in Fe transport